MPQDRMVEAGPTKTAQCESDDRSTHAAPDNRFHASSSSNLFPLETKPGAKHHCQQHAALQAGKRSKTVAESGWTHLEGKVSTARFEVKVWSDAVSKALASTKEARSKALAAIYVICWSMRDDSHVRGEFLKDHGQRVHGRVENWVTPVVQVLLRESNPVCRSQITKYAGAIGFALKQSTEPEHFITCVRDAGGYTGAYQKFSQLADSNGDAKLAEKIDRQELINEFLGPLSDREYEAPPELEGFEQQQIVLLDFVEPGLFRIRKRFNLDQAEIEKFIEQQAKLAGRHAAASPKQVNSFHGRSGANRSEATAQEDHAHGR